jgi:hypothetical protein
MAFKVRDRVWETSTTTGTGTLTLAGAVTGYRLFSAALSDGDETFYFAINQAAPSTEWEVGIAVYTGGTLVRSAAAVMDGGSGPGTLVNFGSGTKDVFIGLPARAPIYDPIYAAKSFV